MMKQFQGRSLAHPGCLVGITAGLTIGIIVAGVLAATFNFALGVILLIWLALTLGLGLLGWIIGERLSFKFFRHKEETSEES
jgi:hypothetical protein